MSQEANQDANIDAYFERLGFSGSIAPSLATLEQLHALHPAVIPFENLDPLLGVPVRLELKNLEQKLLFEKRGGYCLEQNLLFKAVLEDLGFAVEVLGARVLWGHPEDADRPISHVILSVGIGGATYLADVGFGGLTLTAPLRLRPEVEQATPHETFRLLEDGAEWRLQVQIGDEWRSVFAFERAAKTHEEISAINDLVSADAQFRDNLIAARSGKGRRHTLRNLRLHTHVTGGDTETRQLQTVAEIKDVLTGTFGIAPLAGDRLDAALERILARELPAASPQDG
jgi:N-hydroxyarylamine O-acetyltransferase